MNLEKVIVVLKKVLILGIIIWIMGMEAVFAKATFEITSEINLKADNASKTITRINRSNLAQSEQKKEKSKVSHSPLNAIYNNAYPNRLKELILDVGMWFFVILASILSLAWLLKKGVVPRFGISRYQRVVDSITLPNGVTCYIVQVGQSSTEANFFYIVVTSANAVSVAPLSDLDSQRLFTVLNDTLN